MIEMDKREKTLDGLKHHIGQCEYVCDDESCPYWGRACCESYLCEDALELINSYEQCCDEAAIENTEYCEQYEPTYNPEDGSM